MFFNLLSEHLIYAVLLGCKEDFNKCNKKCECEMWNKSPTLPLKSLFSALLNLTTYHLTEVQREITKPSHSKNPEKVSPFLSLCLSLAPRFGRSEISHRSRCCTSPAWWCISLWSIQRGAAAGRRGFIHVNSFGFWEKTHPCSGRQAGWLALHRSFSTRLDFLTLERSAYNNFSLPCLKF